MQITMAGSMTAAFDYYGVETRVSLSLSLSLSHNVPLIFFSKKKGDAHVLIDPAAMLIIHSTNATVLSTNSILISSYQIIRSPTISSNYLFPINHFDYHLIRVQKNGGNKSKRNNNKNPKKREEKRKSKRIK